MRFPGDFLHLCQPDFSGILRGKTLHVPSGQPVIDCKAGWIPSNALITFFGALAPTTDPEIGDLLLVPACAKAIELQTLDRALHLRLLLGRFEYLDGEPWECCTRTILAEAVNRLRQRFGLEIEIGIELECYLLDNPRQSLNAYTVDSFQEEEVFFSEYAELLLQAGIAFKSVHAENGPAQFELTLVHTDPLNAADQLGLCKAIGRLLAQRRQRHLSFAPVVHPDKVGSGLHVHFSLKRTNGQNANCDPQGELSPTAHAFIHGLLDHMESLLALTSPSVLSPLRYCPPRWTAYYNNFAHQDRKAAVRLTHLGEGAQATHFELRTADGTANPYLLLAGILAAGMTGLVQGNTTVMAVPTSIALQESIPGVRKLPDSLSQCLQALKEDRALQEQLNAGFLLPYLRLKQHEVDLLQGKSEAELMQLYNQHY